MSSPYENQVMDHYSRVARDVGLSSSCTMEDEYIREKESRAIHSLIEAVLIANSESRQRILDVGCGNGCTLRMLAEFARGRALVDRLELLGVEKNPDLHDLAVKMNEGLPVVIQKGDILLADTLAFGQASIDVCISQRVLINLLNAEHQKLALANLVDLVKPGGYLLLIECFQDGMDNLNAARNEFGLEPNLPAIHNLYLQNDVLQIPHMEEDAPGGWRVPPNIFSTHYYVQRVLQNAMRGSVIERNSNFVRFFSAALPEAVGNYSPLRIHCFRKRTA